MRYGAREGADCARIAYGVVPDVAERLPGPDHIATLGQGGYQGRRRFPPWVVGGQCCDGPLGVGEQARADLRRAMAAGEPVDEIVDTLVLPLAEQAVPEWQAALDALLPLPEISGRAGYEGGVIAIGIRLTVAEPRISAALLFAGSFVPRTLFEQARQVTIPLQVLLQWDDEGNDRQLALDLFDALGSKEKTLHANLGGHAGVPSFEIDAGARFFARHLS
jgi:hypothetical protein